MTVSAGAPRRPVAATFPPIPLRRRIYGFGSIYGKTIRDSRLSFIIAAGLLGGMALVMGIAVSSIFPTATARLEVDTLIGSIPASMVSLFGKPVSLGTLGGYMTFKYGAIFALGTALWSILALSSTLAGEAHRGSLDFVAVTPFGKRRIALEKVTAHLTMLGLAMAILAVMTTASSTLFGDAALGDQIPLLSSIGFALWCGFLALFFGGLAFALAPILGRAGSAGIASLTMFLLWIANGLEVPGLVFLSPFRWTADHIALVGRYDWLPLGVVGIVALGLLATGVELFVRRDLGVTAGISLPSLPAAVLGVRGPVARAFGDQLPRALSWGIGLGLMGALVASLVGPMANQLGKDPNLSQTFGAIFPGFDLGSTGGWLQLYAELLFIAAGFAAATFVSRWASDETEGRLEMVLATPTARARWVIAGGIGALLAIVVMSLVFAAGIGLGAASGGVAARDPMIGSAALGLYAAAIAGVGIAVGGLWRTSVAAEVAALFVVATYLVDLIAPPLKLPDWVHQLALTAHLGQPMIGAWDVPGVIACAVIAVGGVLIGAWGMQRRDVAR